MYIILSQKIDVDSTYEDELFKTYHYPAKYRNAIHEGDIFIYYQGDRYDKAHRYYFGVGTVGKIRISDDGLTYYAVLKKCKKFKNNVPIYLPDEQYIEQLGYEELRKKPPWQTSIRPLSNEAFNYIIKISGIKYNNNSDKRSLDALEEDLKDAVRSYYRDNKQSAVLKINSISAEMISILWPDKDD